MFSGFNEQGVLPYFLRCVQKIGVSFDIYEIEVLLIDDGSQDNILNIVKDMVN